MGNVISLTSGRPIEVEIEEQKQLDQEFINSQLEVLDKLRDQIATGRFAELIVISRDTESGLFVHDLVFKSETSRSTDIFAWAGILNALTLEVTDLSMMAPTITSDGTVVDPHQEMENGEEW